MIFFAIISLTDSTLDGSGLTLLMSSPPGVGDDEGGEREEERRGKRRSNRRDILGDTVASHSSQPLYGHREPDYVLLQEVFLSDTFSVEYLAVCSM